MKLKIMNIIEKIGILMAAALVAAGLFGYVMMMAIMAMSIGMPVMIVFVFFAILYSIIGVFVYREFKQ